MTHPPDQPIRGVPLDPDLFNPDVVGAARTTDRTPSSPLLPGPNENFYPPSEEIWNLDQDDFDYETEDESDEEPPLNFNRTNSERSINSINTRRSQGDPDYDISTEEEGGDDDDDDDDDEDDDLDNDQDSPGDEESDPEANPGDLCRLIGAIRDRHLNQETDHQGILGEEWDRNMDQELNELKEAEEATKPGRRKRYKPRGEPELSVEVSILLGKANLCFVEKKYDEAIPLFEEIVRIEPMCKMAWNNLGAIYQDMGDFERSSQFRIIGAHLTVKSTDVWKELALESRQHGLLSQAIYCYSQAIKAGKNEVESMWDRSYLLFEVGRSRQALAGYLSILKITPHNPDVLREVAHLCATTGEKEQPIKLFREALKHYQTTLPSPSEAWLSSGFGLEHVHILVKLLMKSCPSSSTTSTTGQQQSSNLTPEEEEQIYHHYYDTLKLIKQANRWSQGRSDPNGPNYLDWDSLEDDREYDPIRQTRECWENLSDQRFEQCPTFPLDDELRTYLGICRLHLGDEEEAALHFDLVKRSGVKGNAELYMNIGDAYFECNQWDEALDSYQDLTENDSTNNSILWHKIGQCYRQLGNFEGALDCFEAVTETDPLDLAAKTQLAELYEQLGYRQKAIDMVNNLIELRRKARESGIAIENDPIFIGSGGNNPQAKTINTLAMRAPASKSMACKILDEKVRTQKYVKTYEKLDTISSKLATNQFADDVLLMAEYVRLASPLIEGFRQTPALFPCALGSKFGGMYSAVMRSNKRSEGTTLAKPTDTEEIDHSVTGHEFRGILFTNWVRIFVYYGFSCAKLKRADEACEVLGHVMRVPTFRQSAPMQQVLRLAYAACCYAKQDFVEVIDTIRWLSRVLLFHNDPVRLINALLSRGFQASVAFFNTNTQKWLLRQVQLIDVYIEELRSQAGSNQNESNDTTQQDEGDSSAIHHDERNQIRINLQDKIRIERDMIREQGEGEGEDEDDSYWKPSKFRPTKLNPVFSVTFAQILAGTRSFKSAIIYYLRVYESYPNEPLLNLLLAVTYVQRAMQRQTDNRHHQIVQALAFLEHYRKLRSTEFAQEVEFNLGRLYHGLGLITLAITHYNQVLNLASTIDRSGSSATDLSNLAAYNLILIYSTSGSPDLAHRLICQYFTV